MKADLITRYNRNDARGIISAPYPPKPGFSLIPMGVADMDIASCPLAVEAIQKRLENPVLGYFMIPDDYYNAIIDHHQRRGFQLEKEEIFYDNGIKGSIVTCLKALAQPHEKVLLNIPAYTGFIHELSSHDYDIVASDLVLQEGRYTLNFADMEEKIRNQHIRFYLLCNPHNPCGTVFNKNELSKVLDLVRKYDLTLLCDEAWSDITYVDFHPILSLAQKDLKVIAFGGPCKGFNISGVGGSYHFMQNRELLKRFRPVYEKETFNHPNVFQTDVLKAVYCDEGENWLTQVKTHLKECVEIAHTLLSKHPNLSLCATEGTYFLFLDTEPYLIKYHLDFDTLLNRGYEVGLLWLDGEGFGLKNHIRINVAMPIDELKEALKRMDDYVFIEG